MNKGKKNDYRSRITACFIPLVLALCGIQVTAQAATLPGWKSAPYSQSGTKTSFGLGNSSSQITPPPGYQYAGNYGVPNAAVPGTTFGMTAEGKVFIPNRAGYSDGVMYPYRYESKQNWGDLAAAVAGFVGGPLGVACALACPLLGDALTRSDLRYAPDDPKVIEKRTPDSEIPGSSEYRWTDLESWGTAEGSCKAYLSRIAAIPGADDKVFVRIRTAPAHADWACVYNEVSKKTGDVVYANAERVGVQERTGDSTHTDKWVRATIDEIRAAMDKSFPTGGISPGVIPEILNKGGDVPLPKPSEITVTGPTTLPGGSTTTTNSDGSRTVETTSRNFSSGAPGSSNVINNTSNTTTTTIYNIDNSVRSTSTRTDTPSGNETTKEEQQEECKEGSTKLSCAELDTPEGEIPKSSKTITFQAEEVGVVGNCPANVSMAFRAIPGIGQQQIINWSGFCDKAIAIRAIVMALAAIMAFFIVLPGGRVE